MLELTTSKVEAQEVKINGEIFHVKPLGFNQAIQIQKLSKSEDQTAAAVEIFEIYKSNISHPDGQEKVDAVFDSLSMAETPDFITKLFAVADREKLNA